MCGLAGMLRLTADASIDRDALRCMAAQLTHRGPDDEGYYLDPQQRCGLAFRRLAIIDLSGGHQPLSNEDGTVWVVLNGEIYNFRALRAELEARGHLFRTQTDTEVIVHLYEDHGADCLDRLAGMFALAIWDERRGELLLARDRFGKKPLVYAEHAGALCFASELKALLALPGFPRRLDRQSLHRYLLFQYVPAPHAALRGVRKLPPAHRVTFRPQDRSPVEPRPYWRLPRASFDGTYADALARLDELLRAAVRRRLVADVPLGAFLSGGIDSGLVVAIMKAEGAEPLRTFTIGFEDSRYDERAAAAAVARHVGTEHHEHVVTPRAEEVLDTLAWHYDEPFADSSAIPTYYVSRWARQSVTVALTGDGGDEAFAGYDRYRALQLASRLDFLPSPLRRGLARLAGALPRARAKSLGSRAYRFAAGVGADASRRYLSWVNVFTPAGLQAGYDPAFAGEIEFEEPLRWFDGVFSVGGRDVVDRAVHADLASYLPGDLLTKVDIASMACSLECRAPFLDHDLVAFASSLPVAWRCGPGGGKKILRDYARRWLPAGSLGRPKMGFGVPVGEWMRGPLAPLVREVVVREPHLCRRIFCRKWLSRLVDAHLSGRENWEHPLWALIMLELWARRWGVEF